MRIARLSFWPLALALAACAGNTSPSPTAAIPASLERQSTSGVATIFRKTYTIPAMCGITGCTAPVYLNGIQAGTVRYSDGIAYFQPSALVGTITFLGTTFYDLNGTFSNTGTTSVNGVTYYVWTLNGKFSHNRDTFLENFDVRGHSGRGGGITIINTGGTITTPLVTPSPSPTPRPRPTPTPD